jgi:chromosome segregation ATPase
MKDLHLKLERIKAIASKENGFVSETISKLREDHERVSTQLGRIKQQLAHLAEVLANGGMAALATVKEKLEALEAERTELEESKSRLKAELEAEESQEIAIEAHVKSLALFDAFIAEHADEPSG